MHRRFALRSLFLLFALSQSTCVPVNRSFRQTPDGIPVYVVSNGFHTDILFPLREARTGTFWLAFLASPEWTARYAQHGYVGIGWGDEGFYLSSYGGRMPSLATTLKAAFWPTPTLMHVSFYRNRPRPGRRVASVRLSEAQYRSLAGFVQATFARDSSNNLRPLAAPGYAADDYFFRAQGSYHAFRTCNDWTNQALKQAGIRAAWRAPLASAVLRQLRRAE